MRVGLDPVWVLIPTGPLPNGVARAAKREGELHNLMLDCVSQMEKAGNAGSYIESTLKAVKSWLAHNGKETRRRIKIRGARDTPSLRDERVPTREELRRILLSGDKKARTACILVAHSGLRIEVLGNYAGTDGLTVKDVPELRIEGESVVFDRLPALVTVRSARAHSVLIAIRCFVSITEPLLTAILSWYGSHRQNAGRISELVFQFEAFFKTLRKTFEA